VKYDSPRLHPELVEGHRFGGLDSHEVLQAGQNPGRMVPRARRGAMGYPSEQNPVYFVYILRCADGSFYVGSSEDPKSRVEAHNDGRGAAYTYKHRPVRLVYSEALNSETAAINRERQIKRWSHKKKQALVDGDIEVLKHLSKNRH
jgi:putative endonuclease